MNKARLVLYDDLLILDETEVVFCDRKNLEGIAASCLRSTPGAETAEIYIKNKLSLKFQLTRKGNIKKMNIHPNWGGRRPGSGRKKQFGTRTNLVHFRVDDETMEFLNSLLNKKADFLRAAVKEKMDRENK